VLWFCKIDDAVAVVNDGSGTVTYGALLADTTAKLLHEDPVCVETVKDLLVTNAKIFFASGCKPMLDGRSALDEAQKVSKHLKLCDTVLSSELVLCAAPVFGGERSRRGLPDGQYQAAVWRAL
jgi:hypothetical protein